MRKTNNLLLGIIIGIFSTTIIILLPETLPKHWFNNSTELLTAIGTVGAVICSLWVSHDSKKVKFNPEVKIDMGEPNSAAIEYIRYQIYGYNSGNIGDAIVKVNFFAESKGKNLKFFSKEQMINVKPVNFLDSGVLCEKVNSANQCFIEQVGMLFTQYVIRNYETVCFELITYSGKKYKGYAKTTVHSSPKYAIYKDDSFGIYRVSALDGNTILNREMLKLDEIKSKFKVDQELLAESNNDIEIYSWIQDKETANKILKQYIKELQDKF